MDQQILEIRFTRGQWKLHIVWNTLRDTFYIQLYFVLELRVFACTSDIFYHIYVIIYFIALKAVWLSVFSIVFRPLLSCQHHVGVIHHCRYWSGPDATTAVALGYSTLLSACPLLLCVINVFSYIMSSYLHMALFHITFYLITIYILSYCVLLF